MPPFFFPLRDAKKKKEFVFVVVGVVSRGWCWCRGYVCLFFWFCFMCKEVSNSFFVVLFPT